MQTKNSIPTKNLLDPDTAESVFKCLIVFNYKSKYDPNLDAKHNMHSKDFLEERYGKALNFTQYTAYHHIKIFLNILSNQNQLKVAELYWNTDGKNWKTPNNYICSFKPVGEFQGLVEYFNPKKPTLIIERPKELIKTYAQYQGERTLHAKKVAR